MISRIFLLSIVYIITPLISIHAMERRQTSSRGRHHKVIHPGGRRSVSSYPQNNSAQNSNFQDSNVHGGYPQGSYSNVSYYVGQIKKGNTWHYQEACQHANSLLLSRNRSDLLDSCDIYAALVEAGYPAAWGDALVAAVELNNSETSGYFINSKAFDLLYKLMRAGCDRAQEYAFEQLIFYKGLILSGETFNRDPHANWNIRNLIIVLLEVKYDETLPLARELVTYLATSGNSQGQEFYLFPLVFKKHEQSLQDTCDAIRSSMKTNRSYHHGLFLNLIKLCYEPAFELGLEIVGALKAEGILDCPYGHIPEELIYSILYTLVDVDYVPSYAVAVEEASNQLQRSREHNVNKDPWCILLQNAAFKWNQMQAYTV